MFLSFRRSDPYSYTSRFSDVLVALDHIVRIEPTYWAVDEQGDRFRTSPGPPSEKVVREYDVYDSLGGIHHTLGASEATRKKIEEIWQASAPMHDS